MAVIPKRTKYRRPHRLRYDGKAKGNTSLHFGEYGLMALEGAWITQNQIEAARVAMTRYMKRGKGQPEKWVAVVKEGKIMFEVGGVSEEIAREALRLAMHKLPIKCKFVSKESGEASEK